MTAIKLRPPLIHATPTWLALSFLHFTESRIPKTMVSEAAVAGNLQNPDAPADVGYFVFQDLSIRKEGEFRLKFSLFELQR
jgi:Velvet factor